MEHKNNSFVSFFLTDSIYIWDNNEGKESLYDRSKKR